MPDPLAAVWEPVLLPILERDPAVQAVTLMRHLQLTHPEAFPDDRVRRTLERRVRDWRALHGPERDVIFRQTPEQGRMALSDFTDASALGVTIGGQLRRDIEGEVSATSQMTIWGKRRSGVARP